MRESSEADSYDEKTFDELVMRYEEPTGMARWDRPLFTVISGEELPMDAIWTALVGSSDDKVVVRPNLATVMVCRTGRLLNVLTRHRLLRRSRTICTNSTRARRKL